jgi:hypothetical protein
MSLVGVAGLLISSSFGVFGVCDPLQGVVVPGVCAPTGVMLPE